MSLAVVLLRFLPSLTAFKISIAVTMPITF
jgi:hypothetical protein